MMIDKVTIMNTLSAKIENLDEILQLLNRVNLPHEGVKEHIHNFIILRNESKVIGLVGLEIYKDKALLRSLAVDPDFQGQGLGTCLFQEILNKARDKHIVEIILLTETAEGFFRKQGFDVISRSHVDKDIKSSVEFQSVCPETAICMRLGL
jgi:amino-acid N-acetyltransferase